MIKVFVDDIQIVCTQAPVLGVTEAVFLELSGWGDAIKEDPELEFKRFSDALGYPHFSLVKNSERSLISKDPTMDAASALKLLGELAYRFSLEIMPGSEGHFDIFDRDGDKWYRIPFNHEQSFCRSVIHLSEEFLSM